MPPLLAGHPAGHADPRGASLCHQPHSAPGTSDCELPDPPASPAERPETHTCAAGTLGHADRQNGRLEMVLTQKVIKGELVIVPDLEYHSCGDLALCLVQPPESVLARRRSRGGSRGTGLEKGSGPFRPGGLPGGGSVGGHP